jgi:hypothetical protein
MTRHFRAPDDRRAYKVGGFTSRGICESGAPEYRYSQGYVVTPHGVVGLYMQDGLTVLTVVLDGLEHRAWWKRRFQERALITLCRRHAAGVADGALG